MSESGDRMDTTQDVTELVPGDAGSQESEAARVSVRDARPELGAVTQKDVVFDVQDVSVYYGDFRAVRDVTLPIYRNEITALIGPSGCGKTTFIRCLNRMNDLIEGAGWRGDPVPRRGPVRPEGGSRRGPAPDRHGVPEAEPVPQVHLRQHRVRPEDRRLQGQPGRPRGGVPPPRRALGRGEGQAEGVGARAVGRAAAAPVHRARDRHAARRDPHGRAVRRRSTRSRRSGSRTSCRSSCPRTRS